MDNQNKRNEPEIKPFKNRKWLTKRVLRIITAFGPILVALVALYLGYLQAHDMNNSNFDIKKYEISYTDKKQTYLELINRVNQIRDIKSEDGIKLNQDNYWGIKDELINSAFGVSIYLSKIESNRLEIECEALWQTKFNDNAIDFQNSINYFKFDLKDILFKN